MVTVSGKMVTVSDFFHVQHPVLLRGDALVVFEELGKVGRVVSKLAGYLRYGKVGVQQHILCHCQYLMLKYIAGRYAHYLVHGIAEVGGVHVHNAGKVAYLQHGICLAVFDGCEVLIQFCRISIYYFLLPWRVGCRFHTGVKVKKATDTYCEYWKAMQCGREI